MSEQTEPSLSTDPGGRYGQRRGDPPKKESGGSGAGNSIGINIIIIILIAGLVAAGWFIANQQQLLAIESARLSEANGRLAVLEERLVATDDAMVEDGKYTKQQIEFWESEIRKLWAVSNERNRNWITDNQKAIKSINDAVAILNTSNRDLQAATSRHEAAFDQQQTMIDQLTALEIQSQQMVRSQRDLVDKVNTAGQAIAKLKTDLQGPVRDNSEAIQSMDAYRVALNSRIAAIERRLEGLQATLAVPGAD